jgi:hypothetical protein
MGSSEVMSDLGKRDILRVGIVVRARLIGSLESLEGLESLESD